MTKFDISEALVFATNKTFERFCLKRDKTANIHELVAIQGTIETIQLFLDTHSSAITDIVFVKHLKLHRHRLDTAKKLLAKLQTFEQV